MAKFFSEKRVLPKRLACIWLTVMMFTATACSLGGNTEQTEISVSKDGKVSVNIVENFDKSYYDIEELQRKILTEAANYNRAAGKGNISVEKIEAEGGVVTVKMIYAGPTDYAEFNNGVFFVGSAKEAQEAGYDIDVVLSGTKDAQETIGMSDILAMTDYQILITDSTDSVVLAGKAAYVSDNVTVSKNRKKVTLAEEAQGPAYVIFR